MPEYTLEPTNLRVQTGWVDSDEKIAIRATDRLGRFTIPLDPFDAGVMGRMLLMFANDARARAGLPAL
ncbi:hypothetical protein MAUB1S_01787 [Mycolicibacterium aubagnense]